jgi:homoserine kinase type II
MAVYTRVTKQDLENLLKDYELGRLVSMKDIVEGVENSNYFITTATGKYILTLYEKRVKPEDLPFFIELMRHAALKGIPCPLPMADRYGEVLHNVCGRPAAVLRYLDGDTTGEIMAGHCRQVGEALGRFHRATEEFEIYRPNALSMAGWEKLATSCLPRADEVTKGLGDLIKDELDFLRQAWPKHTSLPNGVIHADLFPDNVLFNGPQLCGMIDFYFSCFDFLAYDLAVCINAWCFENEKTFSHDRAHDLMMGYASGRMLNDAERKALPVLLRGAALRFLLTRLYDTLNHPPGAVVKVKDPLEYRDKLIFFRENDINRVQAA